MNKIFTFIFAIFLQACALSPGMYDPPSFNKNLENKKVIEITPNLIKNQNTISENYKISNGDELAIVVFGQNEYFPIQSYIGNSPYTKRIVDENGKIFFPYAGEVFVAGYTVSEVRTILTKLLSKNFVDPQLDVGISTFNPNRNIYVLGEVVRPQTMSVGLVGLTLSDAIAQAQGLSPVSSKGNAVFVIRQDSEGGGSVYKANFNNASEFIIAGEFTLIPGDIIFVGAADITKWNRFISQLFPFASFLNQVDNLQN
jgi:protein involved in polysaccharide export with SLBB domain